MGFSTLFPQKASITINNYNLTFEEELGLKQLDAMKEEVTHMYKYKSSNGNIRYDLAPGFENILHDDRSYCMALMGHALFDLRSQDMVRQKKCTQSTSDISKLFSIRAPKKVTRFSERRYGKT